MKNLPGPLFVLVTLSVFYGIVDPLRYVTSINYLINF